MVFSGMLLNTNKNKINTPVEEEAPITLLSTNGTWSLQHGDTNFASSGSRKQWKLLFQRWN